MQNPEIPVPVTVIGLGANLGDRQRTIELAIRAVAGLPGVELVARSSLWQTAPVGGPPQPDFYNAAVAVRSSLDPVSLMRHLLAIEQQFGRVRGAPNAPRTLDLDLLWIEGTALDSSPPAGPNVRVPHPRLRERAFALIPLLEVAPGATDPTSGILYALILAEVGTEGVSPLDSSTA